MAPSAVWPGLQYPMTRPTRVGLIGCGHMGRFHAHTVSKDPHSELVYVCDIQESRSASFAQRYGSCVVNTPSLDVDAIIIASPTETHASFATLAAKAGVATLIEKPVALSSALSALVATYPRAFVGHSERFNPAFIDFEAPLQGELVVKRLAPPTRRSRDIDVVLDLMIHDLDLVLHFWGGIQSAEVVDYTAGPDGIDALTVTLMTRTGLSARLTSSRVSSSVERSWAFTGDVRVRDLLQKDQRPGQPDALQRQWSAFRRALSGRSSAIATGVEGHRAILAAEAIRERVSTNRQALAS
jgi:predicted dehydrogenase